MDDYIILIGRILFVAIFVAGALGHLTATNMMAQVAAAHGVPLARPATIVSGILLAVGAVMILLGVWADVAGILLFAFLVPTAFVMHNFWREKDPQMKMLEQIHFNKDLSLAGAALILAGFVATSGDHYRFFMTGPALSSLFS